MDNYNNIVLMLKDQESGFFVRTIASYEIDKNIEYIDKIYASQEDDEIYIYLTLTSQDIDEDWKYYGILDLYNEEIFSQKDIEFEEVSGDYNPKWTLKFKYLNNDLEIKELLNDILDIHLAELERIIPMINPDDYKE